jgi:pyrroline-5-carboxylate reductase
MSQTIAFIGAGNMGRAIIGGLIESGHLPTSIRVADADHAAAQRLHDQLGVEAHATNGDAAAAASVVVLAVKPQQMREVVTDLTAAIKASGPVVLSIAAGISTRALAGWLGANTAIVRSMPNTPALIGRGTAALYANAAVSAEGRALAATIMSAVGKVHWLEDESLMDAVTALSGSGPAYVFKLIEVLEQAGTALGLPSTLARALALETAAGASALAASSAASPAELRSQVTSKGGTTEAALRVLGEGGLEPLFDRALTAARDRSRTLAEEFGKP